MSETIVLVTGVGGCGVGEGIAKAVRRSDRGYRLFAANMHADAPMLFHADKAFIVPPAGHPSYLATIADLCRREKVDFLIPGSEAELRVLCRHAADFERDRTHLLASPPDVVGLGDDKWKTYEFLLKHGFPTPRTSLLPVTAGFLAETGFPLIVKPRSEGHASKNVFHVANTQEMDAVLHYYAIKRLEPVIQEYVGSETEEYTVSVVIGTKGRVLSSIALRRSILGGFSQRVELQPFNDLRQQCEDVASRLGAFGPVNLQLRWVNGKAYIFEINPRFSGTTPFRADLGFNEVEMLINNILYDTMPDWKTPEQSVFGVRGFQELIVSGDAYRSFPQRLV